MRRWLPLDIQVATATDAAEEGASRGDAVDVVVSPYRVPRAVRASWLPTGLVRFEFRYVDGVERVGPPEAISGNAQSYFGLFTHRPMQLELTTPKRGGAAAASEMRADLRDALRRVMMRGSKAEDRALRPILEALHGVVPAIVRELERAQ